MNARNRTRWVLFAGLLLFSGLPAATAWSDQKLEGKYRVVIIDQGKERVVIGEVTDAGDAYLVEERKGIKVRYPKTQVKKIEPYQAESNDGGSSPTAGRSGIGDEVIQDILGSDSIDEQLRRLVAESDNVDLRAELPLDQDSLADAMNIAGKKAKYFGTDHFVFIYTSERSQAQALAARLEKVYDWCVVYMEQLKIPRNQPDAKLEIFYFATYEEYNAYQTLNGFSEMNALGFYMPTKNRSAFYDMNTFPPVKAQLEAMKTMPLDQRRPLENRYKRWAEHTNLEVVQHEAAHHIHFNVGIYDRFADLPRWMVEGLATMFEVPPSSVGGSLGAINHSRLGEFRSFYGEKGERLTPDYVQSIALRDEGGYTAYVMGWALIHYLRTRHTEEFSKWVCALADREQSSGLSLTAQQQQFEDSFGVIDEKWVKEFAEFIASIEYRPSLDFRTKFP